MAYRFAVLEKVNQLPDAWHQLAKESVVMQSSNICLQECSGISDLENFYLLAYEGDAVKLIMYFQLLAVKPYHFNLADKRFQQISLSAALTLVKPTLLVAGNLFRHDAGFFQFARGLPVESRPVLFNEAVEHMIRHTNASGIFLKDVPEGIASFFAKDSSYSALENDISMEIHIPAIWESFRDYEKELKHKYLQRCKKIRKAFDGVAVRELNREEVIQYSETIFALYLQVTRKQLVSMGMLNASFIENLKKELKDSYRVYGFFLGDKMIAFSSAILHNGEYDMNYIGIDYAYNQSHSLYFNILFHCLESAILNKSSKLVLGRTALEAKAIAGCTPDYRYSFYKLRNSVVNWFFQRVSKYFSEQQGELWKGRHPFKSSYYTYAGAGKHPDELSHPPLMPKKKNKKCGRL